MKVARYVGPGEIHVTEVPVPSIASGEVLLRTAVCGVCATDVKTFVRGHPLIPPGAVLGHEVSGVILQSRAEGWRPGDRVAVAPYVSCGTCRHCVRGQHVLCPNLHGASLDPGGFSEYVRVPAKLVQAGLYLLPDDLDMATASLAEPVACCYAGLQALQLRRDDRLLIIGDGPMGLLQVVVAREMGVGQVILAGMTPERLAWGSGRADCSIDVGQRDLREAVLELTDGDGADKVMVSVGQAAVAASGLNVVSRGGAVNLFAGLPGGSMLQVDPNRIHYDGLVLVGSSGFASHHFRRAVEALGSGVVDVSGLITRRMRLEELEQALRESAKYQGIKAVVTFD